MTDSEILELDIPDTCLEKSRELLAAIEAANLNRKVPHEAAEVFGGVGDDPLYFVLEGGSDGTFAHVRFLDDYGDLMPHIVDLAAMVAGSRGLAL